MVNQPELELQLKVWKELAISKQMLMRAATDALKLDPNCSQDELKQALEEVLKKIAKADSEVVSAREQAKTAVATMEKKVTTTEQALNSAQAAVKELQTAQDNQSRQMATERAAAAKELQKFKDRVAEQEKALKAINTALSDTPENVLRKMNALKKQKQEEADARRQVESTLNKLQADKRQQDQKLSDLTRNTAKLVTQYRDLHALTLKLHEQLKPTIADEKELPVVPELDTKLLEEIEQGDGKSADGKSKSEGKSKK